MREFVKETHTCTKCQAIIQYTNIGSWRNAKTKIGKGNKLKCQPCASKEGRDNSLKTPTGRPKGSRTHPDKLINHSRPGAGRRLNAIKETTAYYRWLDGMAKDKGWMSWEDYTTNIKTYRQYRANVLRITNQQPIQQLENFNKRGVNGQTGVYTLDHIISVKRGFIENIPPEQIGHISNLQMLPWEENITKGWK